MNAKYERIGERACYPSLAALPQPPDCVVLVVPREGVEAALEEAAAARRRRRDRLRLGLRRDGARRGRGRAQRRLADIARAARMPMLGPNCMGLVNHALGVGVSFIPEYARVPRTRRADRLREPVGRARLLRSRRPADRGLGIRYFFSVGNSADVDVADLIARDGRGSGRASAIACLFEGAPSAARMLEAGERARRAGKPVIVYKLGTSEDGAAAARSHTGSLAGSAVAWRALFDRAGFVAVEDYEALVEYARFFAAAGKPLARGVAVISGSGGAGVMAADKAARARRADAAAAGGPPARRCARWCRNSARRAIPAIRPGRCSTMPESFGACCRALLADPQYGVLVVPGTRGRDARPPRTACRQMSALAREQPKPVGAGVALGVAAGAGLGRLRGGRADSAVPLDGALLRRDRRLACAGGAARRSRAAAARRRARRRRRARCSPAAGETLTESEAKRVLAAYGVPVVEERLARSADEAAAAARALGYPVVLKAEAPTILHKTELDVVRLGIANEAELRPAYAEIVAAARGHELHGVLVQPMIPGVEVIVGRARRSGGRPGGGGGLRRRAGGADARHAWRRSRR